MHNPTRRAAALVAVVSLTVWAAACSSSSGGRAGAGSTAPTVPAPTTGGPAASTTTTASTSASGVATSAATTSTPAATTPAATTTGASAATTPLTTAGAPLATPHLAGLQVSLTEVAKLDSPVALAVRAGDPALYVASKTGALHALAGGTDTVVLDLAGSLSSGGEQGFLGFAFAPDGSRLYVSYTDPSGTSTIDEYAWLDGHADPASRRTVLTQEQPYANHNGGNIVFGPDGMLYLGFGDGGSGNDPQRRALRLDTVLGKLLRIDPRLQPDGSYGVPADNPFVGEDGARTEIWSLGLRNPWRFSFDRANGDLWIGDVGQGTIEEVDHAAASEGRGRGVNYGWSAWEGTNRFNRDVSADDQTPPVHEYEHGSLGCSITGGYVYRGTRIPALSGAYVFGDYCAAGLRAIDPAAPAEAVSISGEPAQLASFGEDAAGELYALSLTGSVYRLDPA